MSCVDIWPPVWPWDDKDHPMDSHSLGYGCTTSLTCGTHKFGVRAEELLQRLRIPACDHTNGLCRLPALLIFPEVLPEMGQMIMRMRIDPLLHGFRPLLVRDGHIPDRPPDRPAEGFNNFPHGQRFAHHRVHIVRRRAGTSQKRRGYAGYVCGASKRNDGLALAPWQEGGILLGHA